MEERQGVSDAEMVGFKGNDNREVFAVEDEDFMKH